MVVSSSTDKKFVSANYNERVGFVPTMVALVVGWALAAISFVAALSLLSYNIPAAIIIFFGTGLISIYMAVLTRQYKLQSHLRFELLISPTEVTLYTYDMAKNRQTVDAVLFSQVSGAEYFAARDVAAVTLKSPMHDLEIPLWSFGKGSGEILDALRQHGLQLVDVTRTTDATNF